MKPTDLKLAMQRLQRAGSVEGHVLSVNPDGNANVMFAAAGVSRIVAVARGVSPMAGDGCLLQYLPDSRKWLMTASYPTAGQKVHPGGLTGGYRMILPRAVITDEAASFTIPDIPQVGTTLIVRIWARCTAAVNAPQMLYFRFAGYNAALYQHVNMSGFNGTANSVAVLNDTEWQIERAITPANAVSWHVSQIEITLPRYSSAEGRMAMWRAVAFGNGNTQFTITEGGGYCGGGNPVTSLQIFSNAGNFIETTAYQLEIL